MIGNNVYAEAAAALRESSSAIAVTGAGISVESGIPDFRSPDGIWATYPPEEFATIQAFLADPEKVWRFWHDLSDICAGVVPNAGHHALVALEQRGLLKAVITQNVDNLHQDAGSANVIEFHGNGRWLRCLRCRKREPRVRGIRHMPTCGCGAILKPDVVLFGEDIPRYAQLECNAWVQQCDVVLVVGTSAMVYPAADIPYAAKERGARIIECNIAPTDFTETITDYFIQGPAGQTLPRLLGAI